MYNPTRRITVYFEVNVHISTVTCFISPQHTSYNSTVVHWIALSIMFYFSITNLFVNTHKRFSTQLNISDYWKFDIFYFLFTITLFCHHVVTHCHGHCLHHHTCLTVHSSVHCGAGGLLFDGQLVDRHTDRRTSNEEALTLL